MNINHVNKQYNKVRKLEKYNLPKKLDVNLPGTFKVLGKWVDYLLPLPLILNKELTLIFVHLWQKLSMNQKITSRFKILKPTIGVV